MSILCALADDEIVGGVAVITVAGELDYAFSPELRERILAHIAAGRRRVLLDLSSVTFIDSTAIGVIVGAMSRLRDLGEGAVAVVCAEPAGADGGAEEFGVRRIFEIAGVDGTVALFGSREDALRGLAAVR